MPHTQRGYRVGRYVLFDEIARGGMASVHIGRLEGTAGFKRTVAIKRLHPTYSESPEFVAMLLDEGRITARIRHPNVVPVLDVLAAEHELLLVMEYVHGESLANLLEAARGSGNPPPLRFVAQIFANVLSGLHAAHECTSDDGTPLRVVHRDVSPQNIIIGSDGIARILDFGIARAEQRSRANTRDGIVRGKVPYMAPEQLGEEGVDRRADIYSASVVLWETLTGRPLYDDTIPVMVALKLSEPAERASSYIPDLPADVDEIIAKGLATDPEDRWATAEEMARALERAVPPVAARQVGEWVQTVAGAELARRAAIVTRAEDESEQRVAVPLPRRSKPPGGVTAGADGGEYTSSDVTLRRGVPGKRRRAVIAFATVLLTLVAIGVLAGTRRSPAAAHMTSASESVASADPFVGSTPTKSVSAAVPGGTTSSEGHGAPRSSESAHIGAVSSPKKKGAPSRRPACDPPFRVDERGVRILKKECF